MSSTPQWYMAIGGQQVGPVRSRTSSTRSRAAAPTPTRWSSSPGMPSWTPLREVPKFQPQLRPAAPAARRRLASARPPRPAAASAHEIDYTIEGEDLQFVEVELDPGESVVAEAGALMYMTAGIQMETIFGDGSAQSRAAA